MTKRDKLIRIIYFSDDGEQALEAWEKLKSLDIEDNKDGVFWSTIAVKRNGSLAHEKVRQKAWKDMLKRGIKKPETTLYYLSVNAPEPFNYKARNLLDKHLAKNKPS